MQGKKSGAEILLQLQNSPLFAGDFKQFSQDIVITERGIAKGGFANVHAGRQIKENRTVALKEYLNIIDTDDIIEEQRIEQKLYAIIVLPLATSDLQKLSQEGSICNELDVEIMLEQVLCALRFLKNHLGIFHRDIKPANILVLEKGRYCLTDFGVSKNIEKKLNIIKISQKQLLVGEDELVGTLCYLAPEVAEAFINMNTDSTLKNQISFDVEKADIFSLGITCLDVLFRLTPHQVKGLNTKQEEMRLKEILLRVQKDRLRQTLQGMLEQNPLQRFNTNKSLCTLIQSCGIAAHSTAGSGLEQEIIKLREQLINKDQQLEQHTEKCSKNQNEIQKLKSRIAELELLISSGHTELIAQQIQKLQKTKLSPHSKYVTAVKFSPNSEILASGSWDNTVKLWDIRTKTLIETLKLNYEYLYSLAFSPDGKKIATGNGENSVEIIDLSKKGSNSVLFGHTQAIYCVAFSPDGQMLATGSLDGTAKIWNTTTLKEQTTLRGHLAAVQSVAFSPDGSILATGSADYNIKLWDPKDFSRTKANLNGHSNRVWSVAFSPNGKFLASGSFDKSVRLWDTQTNCTIATLIGHKSFIYSVTVSSDSKRIASAGADQTVRLWDVKSATEIIALQGHSQLVYSVAMSGDGKYLASGSYDNTVIIQDLV